jgi:hypothetical protein
VTLPKRQKMLLSKSIVHAVRSQNPPGRFLQKDANTDRWYDVGDNRAVEKTSQALREGAPDIRSKKASEDNDSDKEAEQSEKRPASAAHKKPAPVNFVMPPAYHGAPMFPQCAPVYSMPSPAPGGLVMIPTMLPPPVPAQGPLPQRKPKKKKKKVPTAAAATTTAEASVAEPQRKDDEIPEEPTARARQELEIHADKHTIIPSPIGTASSQTTTPTSFLKPPPPIPPPPPVPQQKQPAIRTEYVASHQDFPEVEPPAGFDPNGEFSLGSLALTDAEQMRLEHGLSTGSVLTMDGPQRTMEPPRPVKQQATNNSYRHDGPRTAQTFQEREAYRQKPSDARDSQWAHDRSRRMQESMAPPTDLEHAGLSVGTMMSAKTIDGPPEVPLEPAGLSVGTMMSWAASTGQGRLGQTGTSFGTQMSCAPVDGGLEDIGTSFGSLSLTGRPANNGAYWQEAMAEATPTLLSLQRSRGNLLECSDTESEDESASANKSSQRSVEWERFKAAFEEQRHHHHQQQQHHHQTLPYPQHHEYHSNDDTNNQYPMQAPPPVRDTRSFFEADVSVPTTTFDRDFSQLSAMSDADFDRYPSTAGYSQEREADFHNMPPPGYAKTYSETPYWEIDPRGSVYPRQENGVAADHTYYRR